MAGRKTQGWVPNQHGAWAMLLGPYLAGVILRLRDADWQPYVIPLLACWLLGYFAFHAASLWLKAAPARRGRYRPALITYAAFSGTAGLLTLLLAGPGLAGWALPFVPLLVPALWLAWRRNERAVTGGGLTVAAASLMALVARFASPSEFLAAWPGSAAQRAVALALVLFGYFFGTVLYVKTMIRERGRPEWLAASLGWHGALTLAALVWAWPAGGPGAWFWTGFFALTLVRSWTIPRLARTRPITPKTVGLIEVAFSVLALAGIYLT
ncbi:MAG: YwiC-like family protein [Micropruina sp.]|nr:MAG: YwiC-like family protein [Micropruina sp.]